MAKPTKTDAGTWRIQFKAGGKRYTGTFATKRETEQWQAEQMAAARDRRTGREGEKKTVRDALLRFSEETSHRKKWAWERQRLAAIAAQPSFPASVRITALTPADMAAWRDARLKVNAPGTVLRDGNLLSAVFELARMEWGWLDTNPMRSIRKPSQPKARQRVLTWRELRGMARALGWRRGPARSTSHAVALAMFLALRTGMRAGELCGLEWRRVYAAHAHLPTTKNGQPRDVPLTPKALRLLSTLRGWNDDLVLGLKVQTLDALFRRAREKAGLSGFTFHDLRHSAATMIAGRMRSGNATAQQAVLDLCRVFGWTNINQALGYYQPDPADIAKRMS